MRVREPAHPPLILSVVIQKGSAQLLFFARQSNNDVHTAHLSALSFSTTVSGPPPLIQRVLTAQLLSRRLPYQNVLSAHMRHLSLPYFGV